MQLFRTPISLVLMALDADRTDRHIGFQQAFDQLCVCFACIEVVDEQNCIRISFLRGGKDFLYQTDPAFFDTDPGDGVVVPVKDGHDHHFIDHIPQTDHTSESGYVAMNAFDLPAQNLFV